jgi:hypothetical protein
MLLASCNSPGDPPVVPPYVLQQDEFARVLADLSLAESIANMNPLNVPAFKIDTVYAFNPIEARGVSREKFDSSIAFYSRHPLQYKAVYEKVLAVLDSMKRVK